MQQTNEQTNEQPTNRVNTIRFTKEMHRAFSAGYQAGIKKGFEQNAGDLFNSMTSFLQIKLKELEAEGKTLSEAIEILNK